MYMPWSVIDFEGPIAKIIQPVFLFQISIGLLASSAFIYFLKKSRTIKTFLMMLVLSQIFGLVSLCVSAIYLFGISLTGIDSGTIGFIIFFIIWLIGIIAGPWNIYLVMKQRIPKE